MKDVRVVGIQIAIEPNKPDENIEKMIKWMYRAKNDYNPELIVFAETITTGFQTALNPNDLWDLVDTIPGRFTKRIGEVAKELDVYVCFGTYERGPERGTVYNSAPLVGPDGELIGVYRKTHIYPTEKQWSTSGMEAEVYDTRFGKVGIIICYDGDYPELSRILGMKGAEIILRPTALLRSFEIWDLTNRARAYDNHVYVIGVNSVGPDGGGNYYFGNSQIVSPIAQPLALATAGECMIYADLKSDPLQKISYGCSIPMIFHHMEDRNLEAYQGILEKAEMQFFPTGRHEVEARRKEKAKEK